ncbi:hypothetical protein AQUCO_02900006v1 [Aquilegia coerulea]|uniref:Sec1 family domain-containing protein MIP3 n=1 Tax=Aquilegia coerulea TaxID=218851 RepID=A0A2G5D2X2_AQUCA|nr:hypothetical protein AQUCO_02900006v1 [Aquilegia coerulea]
MMASADLIKCCLDSIRNISDHIEDALIYLDAGCIEAFQFLGAYPLLLELGARAVCSLENICSLDTVVDWKSNLTQAKKVVVITSRLLSDSHRYILRCLSTHTAVLHCTVFTSISEIAHSAYIDSPLGPDAFHEYESLLIQDYEEIIRKHKTKEQSSPQHSEFIYPEESNLSARVALENEEGTVAEACLSNQHEDSLSAGLPPISSGSPFDGEDTPSGAIFTAHFLYHLAAKMDLKLEIFSLGNLSKTIGKMLIDMSSLYDVGRRKRSAGLLLVDRTLDLITTCCHGDSLVDRIFSSLPRRDRKTLPSQAMQNKQGPSSVVRAPLDVQIPLGQYLVKEETLKDETSVMEAFEIFLRGWTSSESDSKATDFVNFSSIVHDKSSIHSDSGILSGSLVSTEHYQGTQYSEALLYRRTKDGTLLIKKWLEEILRREKLTVPMKSRSRNPTTAELQSMITSLSKDQSSLMRNKGIIQQAVASVLALSEPHSSRWDAFVGAEKILRVSATSEMSQSLSAQIRDLVHRSVLVSSHEQKILNRESSRGLLSFRDALLLAITGYILAGENFPSSGSGGPFSWEDEHFLKEAIIDAILEDPGAANLKFLHGLGKELEANFNKKKPDDMPKEDSSKQLAVDDFDDDQWGNWGDENADQNSEHVYDDMQLKLELHDRVDGLFKFFHKLCGLKRSNIISRDGLSGLETGFGGNPSEGKGLLFKILTMVLGKYDVPGLEYHSSTVGRLFKSGFGRFGLGQAKPSLGDQNVILIFVVGGINGHEVIEVQEALLENGREDIELILGGTTLLTADDMLELLLGSSSHV